MALRIIHTGLDIFVKIVMSVDPYFTHANDIKLQIWDQVGGRWGIKKKKVFPTTCRAAKR